MNWRLTQQTAMMCAWYMRITRYNPNTIINVGIGSGPELTMWQWLMPDVVVVGIDGWYKHKVVCCASEFIHAVATDGTSPTTAFCLKCRSLVCRGYERNEDHVALGYVRELPAITIDSVASSYKPPFFLWMDIDGSEIVALKGIDASLPDIGWINIEEVDWIPGHADAVRQAMREMGFVPVCRHRTEDVLYCTSDIAKAHRLSVIQ